MPPKKRTSVGRSTSSSRRTAASRAVENPEQTSNRLADQRVWDGVVAVFDLNVVIQMDFGFLPDGVLVADHGALLQVRQRLA